MPQQISKGRKMNTNKLVYFKNHGKASAKSKGSKICPEGKHGLKELLTPTQKVHMQTLLHPNTVNPKLRKEVQRFKRKGK